MPWNPNSIPIFPNFIAGSNKHVNNRSKGRSSYCAFVDVGKCVGAIVPPVVLSFLSVFARLRFLSGGQKISFVAPGHRHNSRLIFELKRRRVIRLQVWYYRRIGTHSHSGGLKVLS